MKKTCKILAFLMAVLLLAPCFGSAESEYPSYLNLDGYRPIVKEGEKVSTKQKIGKIFTDSENDNKTELYLMIYKNTTIENPELWLAL